MTPTVHPNDVKRFTEGYCHILARAIHVRTGWPMMAFSFHGAPELHAFVRMPDGRALDAEGVCSLRAMKRRWDHWRVAEFDWPSLTAFSAPRPPAYTYRRARIVADRLLDSLNHQQEVPA